MLADVVDQRPTAHQLRRDLFPHTSLQNVQTASSSSFGVSSPPINQVNGTTIIYSAASTAMGWTQMATKAIFQGNPQPNPGAVRTPQVPSNPPVQPGPRRKRSVKSAKSVDERQKKGYKPSQSAGVP